MSLMSARQSQASRRATPSPHNGVTAAEPATLRSGMKDTSAHSCLSSPGWTLALFLTLKSRAIIPKQPIQPPSLTLPLKTLAALASLIHQGTGCSLQAAAHSDKAILC